MAQDGCQSSRNHIQLQAGRKEGEEKKTFLGLGLSGWRTGSTRKPCFVSSESLAPVLGRMVPKGSRASLV